MICRIGDRIFTGLVQLLNCVVFRFVVRLVLQQVVNKSTTDRRKWNSGLSMYTELSHHVAVPYAALRILPVRQSVRLSCALRTEFYPVVKQRKINNQVFVDNMNNVKSTNNYVSGITGGSCIFFSVGQIDINVAKKPLVVVLHRGALHVHEITNDVFL